MKEFLDVIKAACRNLVAVEGASLESIKEENVSNKHLSIINSDAGIPGEIVTVELLINEKRFACVDIAREAHKSVFKILPNVSFSISMNYLEFIDIIEEITK